MKMVTITKDEYDSLKRSELMLTALENSGVDNWDWYHEAYTEYRKLLKEAGFDDEF